MRVIKRAQAPVFEAGGTTVTGYASPSRGAAEISAWQVELAPGSVTPVHQLDREEIFLATDGEMVAIIEGDEHSVGAGDCLIVPAGTTFSLAVPGTVPFRALVCLPCGGRASVEGQSFVPPWAE